MIGNINNLQNCRAVSGFILAALALSLCPAAFGGEVSPPSGWVVAEPLPAGVGLKSRLQTGDSDIEFMRFRCASGSDFQKVWLVHEHKPALAMDEFRVTVSLNSAHKGIRPALRLVLPRYIDPRTRLPLVTWIFGDASTGAEQWQKLSIAGNKTAVQSRVRELRGELSQSKIDATGAYFDACALVLELHRGTTYLDVGACDFGPVVTPETIVDKRRAVAEVSRVRGRLQVDRDRLVLNNKAVFLRIFPDHNESAEFLKKLGGNAVWVSDRAAKERLESLSDDGVLLLATPPHPEFDPADFSQPLQGLPPLDELLPLPDIWMLGTHIGVEDFPHLLAWAKEVRSADKNRRRPLMADVISDEGVASRQVGLVGISQHSTGWLRNFGAARNRSFVRQNVTAQLSLPWEWVQTEASAGYADWRTRSGSKAAFVEPEQVMMQLCASLSAGTRAIGFWKTEALDSDSPEKREMATAIELANLYLDILQPLLLEGRVTGHIPVSVTSASKPKLTSPFDTSAADGYSGIPSGPDAAVVNTPGTSLVLAGFWDSASHFVPQRMFAPTAQMTVSATETASAWQIFATGLRGLRRDPAAGGLQLNIRDFDLQAAVLVSSDGEKKRQLESRIQQRAERAGQLFVTLAQLKLARVKQTCATIDAETSSPVLTALRSFQNAQQLIDNAANALSRRDFPSAERFARASMREVRGVQDEYWQRAIQILPTPMASPHTVSFSTLPDHWKMMNTIRGVSPSQNLIPSGDFSNLRLLSEGAWQKISPQDEQYFASADIVTEHAGSNQILQLRAWRRNDDFVPKSGKPSLMVRSPELPASAGDVFEVTMKVKSGQRIRSENESPLLVFDDDLGPEFAVRPTLEPSWRTIRMLRQASMDGPFRIWIALDGVAEVLVDEISVVRRGREAADSDASEGETPGPTVLPVSHGSRGQGAGHSDSSLP